MSIDSLLELLIYSGYTNSKCVNIGQSYKTYICTNNIKKFIIGIFNDDVMLVKDMNTDIDYKIEDFIKIINIDNRKNKINNLKIII